MRSFARRHPIALYLTIVFGLGVPLMMLGVLAARGVIPGASLPAKVGLDLEKASALAMVILALFPAALIVSALEGGRPAVAALLRRIVMWRIGLGWWAFIVLALPATTVILALMLGDTFKTPTLAAVAGQVGGFLFGFLLVNWWEESSWAGFMQPGWSSATTSTSLRRSPRFRSRRSTCHSGSSTANLQWATCLRASSCSP